ncbi:MAG TPA: hypothetical protein VGE98_04110 [Thermoanaerobaculia bacterium]
MDDKMRDQATGGGASAEQIFKESTHEGGQTGPQLPKPDLTLSVEVETED